MKPPELRMEDWISRLPDECIISILSLLTIKEAASTSILSTRWRYLWPQITSLNFDPMDIVENSSHGEDSDNKMKVERLNYVNWVNKIWSSIQVQGIDQFKIHFHFDEDCKDDVEKLIKYAMEKKVKKIEIIIPRTSKRYILQWSTVVSSNIQHLKTLNLKRINISGELLEHFLLHCSSLEQISIEDSKYLTTLKVGVQLNNLKILEIIDCFELTDLRICAPNLSKFRYEGHQINLNIESGPSLRHLYIGRVYGDCLAWAFSALSSYLCQIQTLFLHLQLCRVRSDILTQIQKLLKFSSLRELTVKISGPEEDGILYILSLLKASPFLEKFKVLPRLAKRNDGRDLFEEEAIELCPLEHLKVIEIVGYIRDPYGLKFFTSLCKAAIKLEKLVIDPVPTGSSFTSKEERAQFVKKTVELLKPKFPEWAEFVL